MLSDCGRASNLIKSIHWGYTIKTPVVRFQTPNRDPITRCDVRRHTNEVTCQNVPCAEELVTRETPSEKKIHASRRQSPCKSRQEGGNGGLGQGCPLRSGTQPTSMSRAMVQLLGPRGLQRALVSPTRDLARPEAQRIRVRVETHCDILSGPNRHCH
jgi:hypothetical protein